MALVPSGSSGRSIERPSSLGGMTEFEILKASHKFLREEDEKAETWNDKLAEKYYQNLYREFAVCDLKHYKSGQFALRWRTEAEVLSGAGETSCANTRCSLHPAELFETLPEPKPTVSTVELPFGYVEHGESKSALVKVVLCQKCLKKLMWKRTKEKERQSGNMDTNLKEEGDDDADRNPKGRRGDRDGSETHEGRDRRERGDSRRSDGHERRRDPHGHRRDSDSRHRRHRQSNSRSRSPKRSHTSTHRRRSRSRSKDQHHQR